MQETVLREITALKKALDARRETADSAAIREALEIEFLYESNRIEGNTLSLRETQLVINEGITIGGKSVREHLEAINHREAILFVEDLVYRRIDLSEYVLKQLHALVLHAIDRENAGSYRRLPVLIAGSRHVPPQPYLIQPLIDDYFIFYKENKDSLHPVVLAAEMHERLATIHPFIDGNGRTSRLVMNLILLQHGYPLAIIEGDYENRMAYYNALELVSTENNKQIFILFIANKVKTMLERYLKLLN